MNNNMPWWKYKYVRDEVVELSARQPITYSSSRLSPWYNGEESNGTAKMSAYLSSEQGLVLRPLCYYCGSVWRNFADLNWRQDYDFARDVRILICPSCQLMIGIKTTERGPSVAMGQQSITICGSASCGRCMQCQLAMAENNVKYQQGLKGNGVNMQVLSISQIEGMTLETALSALTQVNNEIKTYEEEKVDVPDEMRQAQVQLRIVIMGKKKMSLLTKFQQIALKLAGLKTDDEKRKELEGEKVRLQSLIDER